MFIPEVTITDTHYRNENIGGDKRSFDVEELDSLQSITLVNLLQDEEGIFFKNYGPNTLSTPSIRGGSAGHILVLWNGMPVTSPMLGLLDYSLLSVEGMDEVSVIKGGNSAMWGSGAISGIIDMKNEISFDRHLGLSFHTSYGSFDSWRNGIQFNTANNRFFYGTNIQYQKAENDFPYQISDQLPEEKLENARAEKLDILQNLGYKISDRSRFTLHYWLQSADREIPPTIVQSYNNSSQKDLSNRVILSYQNIGSKGVFKISSAFFRDDIDFYENSKSESIESSFSSWLNDANYTYQFNAHHSLFLGINYNYTVADAEGYRDDQPKENKLSMLTSYTFSNDYWAIQASNRIEMINGKSIPITPQVGIDYTPHNLLRLSAKVSRNYRLPTLNDRYWRPGGNPDLKAESGWSQELTLAVARKKKRVSITGYNRVIDNWILWTPTEDAFYWSAYNVKQVWSRGMESKIYWAKVIKNVNWKIDFGYNLVFSTYQFDLDLPDIDKGEQLFYTPRNTFYGSVKGTYKDFQLSYHHRYNSSSLGVNEDVDAYQIGSVKFDYRMDKWGVNSKVYFHVDNLWNARYYVVERRPMPGRNMQIGINFNFNKK